MANGELQVIRQSLLSFFQDMHVRVSLSQGRTVDPRPVRVRLSQGRIVDPRPVRVSLTQGLLYTPDLKSRVTLSHYEA